MKGNNNSKKYVFTNSKQRWTELEDKQLINNITKFGLNENRIIENLNRTFEACRTRWYIKHNKNIEQKFQIIKKVKKQDEIYYNCLASLWSKNEENKLIQAIELHGTRDWNKISECINTGRSASGCYNKWRKLKKYSDNSNHMQTRNPKRSTTNNNQHKFIDLSNIIIAFADNNSSPTTTPTATTRSSNSLETNQRNSKDVNIFNKNKFTTKIISNNNYSLTNPTSSVVETAQKDDRVSITTIYDFLYRMENITQDKWSMNDVIQLMIIMGKIKLEKGHENTRVEERSWEDVGDKMVKNCVDCKIVWELIRNLSPNIVGDIMINYWRTMN